MFSIGVGMFGQFALLVVMFVIALGLLMTLTRKGRGLTAGHMASRGGVKTTATTDESEKKKASKKEQQNEMEQKILEKQVEKQGDGDKYTIGVGQPTLRADL